MKKLSYLVLLLSAITINAQVSLPFSETFNSSYSSNFNSAAGTSNAGATYTCTAANGVGLITTADYLTTKTLYVDQGQGVSLTFKLNKGGSFNGPVDVYMRVNSTTIFSSSNPSNNGWVKIGTATTFSCGTNSFSIPSEISGGQRICFTIDFKNASSTNWVAIEDLSITEVAGPAVPTTFTENFTTNVWYPTSGYVKIPYHSNSGSSSAYTTLNSNGAQGALDYCATFSTGFDGSSGTNLITPEVNTGSYANGQLSFAFRSQYPCGGPTSYTFDEDYDLYAPEVYIMEGADNGVNTWVRLPVRYYFPDNTWRNATVDISAYKNSNVKFKFERGGFCSNPAEAIDNIKVQDRNCTVSTQPAGTVSGPANISANTNYVYSITPVTGASFYKWTVRSGGNTFSGVPYIVSGQGTTSITVNFGNLPAPLRVLCIPYDADPSSTADACYAPTSFVSTSTCSTPDTASVSITASNTTVCPGEQVTFTATPINGGSTPTYQWLVNGVNAGTADSLSTTFTSNAVVRCIMTSSETCITNSPDTSNAISITVNSNGTASVTIAASDTSICPGEQVTFTATPLNEGLTPTYAWRVNGTPAGTNSTTFSSTALTNGAVVTCIMTSSLNCISGSPDTSNAVSITVTSGGTASVTISASATNICAGTAVNFTATPTNGGTAPTYQWKVNGINSGTGTTFSSITLANNDVVTVEMTSNASCISGSPATSNPITITVSTGLVASVNISASDTAVCPGELVNFTAVPANGGTAPTYQWKVNGNNAGTGSIYSDSTLANNDVVTVEMTSTDNCVSSTTVTSNPITITVSTNLTAGVNISATATTICSGTPVDFTATPINGGSAPTYQWKVNGNNVGTGSTYSDSTLANNDVVTAEMTSNDNCVTSATATSNALTITVTSSLAASVGILATDTIICPGQQVDFAATPTNGGNSPTYQWKVNGSNAGTGNTYSSTTLANNDVVTVEMTSSNSCVSNPTVTSNAITIAVSNNLTPSVSISASTTNSCPGGQVDFTATPANGGSAPSYQWKVNGIDAGTDSPVFSITTLSDGDAVTVELTSNAGCASNPNATSNAITISISNVVAGFISASKDTLCAWQTTQFMLIGSTGGPIRWQSSFSSNNNFNDIPNLTNDTVDAPLSVQNTYYRAIVGSGICADTTNALLIVVPQSPIAAFTSVVSHNEVTFNSGSSQGGSDFRWDFGDGSSSIAANPVHVFADSGTYRVCLTLTNSSGCSDTSCIDITAGKPVGIGDLNSNNSFTIYPNPASQFVNITTQSAHYHSVMVRVYDAVGKQVLHTQLSKPFVDVSTLGNGMYLLELQADKQKPQFVKLAVVR